MSRSGLPLDISGLDDESLFKSFFGDDVAVRRSNSGRPPSHAFHSAGSGGTSGTLGSLGRPAPHPPVHKAVSQHPPAAAPPKASSAHELAQLMKVGGLRLGLGSPHSSQGGVGSEHEGRPDARREMGSSGGEMPGSSGGVLACPDHRERLLDVFCIVCNVPICTNCALFGKHKGHRFAPMEQAYHAASTEVRSHLNQLEHRITAMRAFLAEVHNTKSQLKTSSDSCMEQVRNNIQFLKVSLDQKLNALLKEISEHRDSKLALLEAQQQQVLEDISNFEKLAALANTMLDSSSAAHYLKKHKFLNEQILAAGESEKKMSVCCEGELTLRVNVSPQVKSVSDIVLAGAGQVAQRGGEAYSSDLDRNGVFYYLGTVASHSDVFVSPVTKGLVTVECPDWGYADHLDEVLWQENPSSVFTSGQFGSWVCFSINEGFCVKPNRYRIQHAGDCSSHVLRNWVFEASADGVEWDVLSIHNNDVSLGEAEGSHASWEIAGASVKRPYSHFRVTITGANSSNTHHLMLGSVEVWGSLSKSP